MGFPEGEAEESEGSGDAMSVADHEPPLAAEFRRLGLYSEAKAIVEKHGATFKVVASRSRTLHVSRARKELMVLIRERLHWSYPAIGELFGRDKSCAMDAVKERGRLL